MKVTSLSYLLIFIALFGASTSTALANFTDNSGVPTTNNTPIPINSSSSTQVKTGPLVSDSYMQADFFYDRYNYRYYLQPRGTNRLHSVVADNTLTYGEVQGAYFRDRNDGNFYVDPNGVSVLNDIRPTIIYDRNNSGYYLQPRGTSRMNYVVFNNTYTYGAGNYADVYIRNAGRWASQLGVNPSVQGFGLTIRNNGAHYRQNMVPFNGRNYCSLNRVSGRYEGGGEKVEVWVENGWWVLGGHSLQTNMYVTGYCLVL